jgi:hypothetical protein
VTRVPVGVPRGVVTRSPGVPGGAQRHLHIGEGGEHGYQLLSGCLPAVRRYRRRAGRARRPRRTEPVEQVTDPRHQGAPSTRTARTDASRQGAADLWPCTSADGGRHGGVESHTREGGPPWN